MNYKKNILITGGAGFIGSHLVIHFVKKYSNYRIINVDSLTYASNLKNLDEIKGSQNYIFEKADIRDKIAISKILTKYEINNIIHLAAESHVDNSIINPLGFAETNVLGTLTLLDSTRNYWNNNFNDKSFYHVSTDEVYGSLGFEGSFCETTRYDPRSPYSASAASLPLFLFDLSARSTAWTLFKQVKIPFPIGFLLSTDNFIIASIEDLLIKSK